MFCFNKLCLYCAVSSINCVRIDSNAVLVPFKSITALHFDSRIFHLAVLISAGIMLAVGSFKCYLVRNLLPRTS